MREFKGKTAFVTGGASGIGLAMAKAFAENGMNVMLADVEQSALDSALKDLNQYGNHVRGIACDVADADSVERAAQATFEAIGNVHILCNNAGVAAGSAMPAIEANRSTASVKATPSVSIKNEMMSPCLPEEKS